MTLVVGVSAISRSANGAELVHANQINELQHPVIFAQVGGNQITTLEQILSMSATALKAAAAANLLSPALQRFLGELGIYLGENLQFVLNNWNVIGPSVQQMRLAFSVRGAIGPITAYAPTVLATLTVAGLIPLAIYETRMRALEANALNNAREWQMTQAQQADIHRRDPRAPLVLPSMYDTADIIVGGPSVAQVSEELKQRYIRQALLARAQNTARNRGLAIATLRLISQVADEPRD